MIPIANYNLGSVQGSIDIDYDGRGTTEARADVRRLAKELEREKLVAKIEADTKVLQRKRDEALAMLETLVAKTWTPEVQVDIDNARAQLAGFESQLARVDGQRINIEMDIADELARANAELNRTGISAHAARISIAQFGADARDTRGAIESLGKSMSGLAKPFAVAGAIHLASLATTQFTAAVAPAIGVVGLLPGVLGAAGVAMAAVKIGTSGVGDAMSAVAEGDAKKLAEAMAKLSPEAQEFVRSYQAIKPALDGLKLNVQNALFRDLGATMQQLGAFFLPTLDSGLTGVANSLNELARFSAQALMTPASVTALNQVLGNTELMFDNMGGALGEFLNGFLQWAAVGSSYLPQFGSWIQDIADKFEQWSARMVESGQAWTIIDRGLFVLRSLWQILVNIGAIIGMVFKPLAADADSLLGTLVVLTGQARAWLATAEGQKAIADVWQLLSAVSGALLSVIGTLAPIIASIASWFASLPAPVQQVVAQFLAWSIVLGLILTKLAPFISFLVTVGPHLGKVATGLTMLVNGFMAVMRVFRALSLLFMTNPWLLLIAAVIMLVYLIITNWDTIKQYLATAWQWISTTAMTVWNGIVNFFTTIWNFLLSTAIMIFTQVVAFFIGIWSSISGTVMTIWNGIVAFFTFVWEIIFNIFRFAAAILLAIFFTIFNPIRDLVVMIWNGIVAFLTMIWNGIVAQATALWTIMVTVWSTVWNTVSSVAMSIWNAIVGFLAGVWAGISSTASSIWNGILGVITGIWNAIWGFIGPTVMTIVNAISNAWNQAMAVTSSVMNAIWGAISSVWNGIIGFFAGAWNTISGIFSGAVGRVLGILGGLWNTITGLAGSAISLLVNAGRNIVIGLWNGIVAMGSWLYGAIMGWVRSVVPGPILQFLGIASPSRYMRDEVGKQIGPGIAEGIEANSGVAADAAANIASDTGKAAKVAAAQEVLAALNSGQQVYEDFSFKGASQNLKDQNDALADLFYTNGQQFNTADMKSFLTRYIDSAGSTSTPASQTTAQIGSLSPSAQQQLGSLAVSAASTATGTTAVDSATQAAAKATTSSGPTTINIGTLALSVEGNLDPTDPVRWRRAMELIREGITNVEASYR